MATRATKHQLHHKLVGAAEVVAMPPNEGQQTTNHHAASGAAFEIDYDEGELNQLVSAGRRSNGSSKTSGGVAKMMHRSSSSSVSPSSLQSLTTDSDSLQGESGAAPAAVSTVALALAARGSASSSPIERHHSPSAQNHDRNHQSKSPILIKYNYYDYNGERQENHDLLQSSANQQRLQQHGNGQLQATGHHHQQQRIQRQLSPTFKQSLDQIVKSSQQHMAAAAAPASTHTSASPISPRGSPNGFHAPTGSQHQNGATMTLLARRYKLSSYEHRCLRCAKTVYQMDKVGPLKDFTFYHQNCFKCRECGTKLTLKTYFNNQHSSTDREVYCHRHCPKTPAGRLDNQSVGIRAALNAPKVFDPVHQEQFLVAGSAQQQQQQQQLVNNGGAHFQSQHPQVDSRAIHIQHAVRQTKLQAIYKHSQVDKKISQFLNRRLEYLEPKQKMLEMRHREEEEQLFKVFEQKWLQEESSIRDQIREEWQRELNKLLEKYRRQLSSSAANLNLKAASSHQQVPNSNSNSSSNNNNNNHNHNHNQNPPILPPKKAFVSDQKHRVNQQPVSGRLDFHRLPMQETSAQHQNQDRNINDEDDEQKMIELERMNLEKTMTIKLDRKKETLKRKLKEFERQATAELVEKQSREMITLISLKLEEFKEEQKRKIGSDLEQFEAIETLANQLGASLQVSPVRLATGNGGPDDEQQVARAVRQGANAARQNNGQQLLDQPSTNQLATATAIGAPPLPKAPQLSKMDLYNSDQPDELFRDIDQLAINVAKEDQRTFTDLVHHLTRHCLTDVEKVRAVFRWITVKNLNTMEFDSSVKPDTPLGLLRGIKQGSESYHVLFKRLCSYAGLHCVVIKGYSKSAGYQPGLRFEGNRFRNSWNAVYVAGAWRFVQCNWGARHLVSVAVMQDKNNGSNCVDKSHNGARSRAHNHQQADLAPTAGANLGRRGQNSPAHQHSNGSAALDRKHQHQHHPRAQALLAAPSSPTCSSSTSSSSCSYSSSSASSGSIPLNGASINNRPHAPPQANKHHQTRALVDLSSVESSKLAPNQLAPASGSPSDSLRYEYDDHYFLTDPDEFIYEFFPLAPEWQLLKSRPISLQEFEQLPFVRSLFFKYGLYFPQADIRSVLYTNSSGATTIKIGMPTHMIPSLIFHYNLKYFDSDAEHYEGISLKRFVMQSVESGDGMQATTSPSNSTTSDLNSHSDGGNLLSNIVSFRVHVPENGAYILDIFANSTTPNQYVTGEPMKFKSVCKFKIIARNLKTVMVPLPDCASGEYGPMKATRLFGIIPLTHENGLISVHNEKRLLEIQFRMTRPLLDFMASLHKNNHDERQLSKLIKIFIDGDIVFVAIKFHEDGQYGLDIYTRDNQHQHQHHQSPVASQPVRHHQNENPTHLEPKKQLLTHCCKYLINVRASSKS